LIQQNTSLNGNGQLEEEWPSIRDYVKYVENNMLPNLPINKADISCAKTYLGRIDQERKIQYCEKLLTFEMIEGSV